MNKRQERSRLRVLPSGDPKTAFGSMTAREILASYGPPSSLLTSSAKAEKCGRVGVLNKVLYLTSGIFCPAATDGCRKGCLGHTSGRMQMPSSARARDRRAALFLEDREHFLSLLWAELYQLRLSAKHQGLIAAVRLNGTSDLAWERLHPEVFEAFSDLQFFDYTKIAPRMRSFLEGKVVGNPWPHNYHLTFSADERNRKASRELLAQGGNVAVVFEPELPRSWWGHSVIEGDEHDARFLDPRGVIVGLRAKGVAKVDLSGFVVRPCPRCGPVAPELGLVSAHEDTHRTTVHECPCCGCRTCSRWMLPASHRENRAVAACNSLLSIAARRRVAAA